MSTRHLEISFRKGRPISAYLYLRDPRVRSKSAKTGELEPGILVDYSSEGMPLGVEIVTPETLLSERLNEVLDRIGEPALEESEIETLASIRPVTEEREENGKSLFAWYGSATYRAQLFEQELIIILILTARLGDRGLSVEEIDQIDADLSHKTLGSLLTELSKKIELDDWYRDIWSRALSKRNYLIHRFYVDNALELTIKSGRERLISELRSMIELFKEAEARAEVVRVLLQRMMGWSDGMLDQMVEEFLDQEREKHALTPGSRET
jgi:uncharacterized protein YuzE